MRERLVVMTAPELEAIIENAVMKGMERMRPLLVKAAGEYVTAEDAALRIGVSKRVLDKMRRAGEGPSYIHKDKLLLYKVADLEDWLSSYRVELN